MVVRKRHDLAHRDRIEDYRYVNGDRGKGVLGNRTQGDRILGAGRATVFSNSTTQDKRDTRLVCDVLP